MAGYFLCCGRSVFASLCESQTSAMMYADTVVHSQTMMHHRSSMNTMSDAMMHTVKPQRTLSNQSHLAVMQTQRSRSEVVRSQMTNVSYLSVMNESIRAQRPKLSVWKTNSCMDPLVNT